MRTFVSRRLVTVLLVLGALVLSVPAVTLASGGGSAGDQQYTDPFAGTSTPTTGASHTATHTQTATPPPTTAPPTATAPPTGTAPPTSTVAPTTGTGTLTSDPSNMPTATTASRQLPYTGYDGWLAGGLGFTMVSAGLVLRRRVRRS
ncbi:MAG TPA: hypothetical protein VIL16_11635 [Trebonia sp.]